MTKIISVSLKDDVLAEIGRIEKTGFSGRSDVIRAGIRLLSQETGERERLKGTVDAVLLVQYLERHGEGIHEIEHSFGDLVRTRLHSQLEGKGCIELLLLHGDGKRIRQFAERCQARKGMSVTRLIAV